MCDNSFVAAEKKNADDISFRHIFYSFFISFYLIYFFAFFQLAVLVYFVYIQKSMRRWKKWHCAPLSAITMACWVCFDE